MTIKSDGGSSSYYDIDIPQWLLKTLLERNESGTPYIKTEELIEVIFNNDFNHGTLFKSHVRAFKTSIGAGKAGNTMEYECNKMRYYTNKVFLKFQRGDQKDAEQAIVLD